MKITKKQIDKVLEGFNFTAAAEIYKLLNWKWFKGTIPNTDDLRELAIGLLGDLRELPLTKEIHIQSVKSGGLKASKYFDEERVLVVKLEFIALSSVHDNLDLE